MDHPFELDLSTLKAVEFNIVEPLADTEAEMIQGGGAISQTLTAPNPPSESGEDGGRATTLAVGEEGGDTYTTLAIGEEGGGNHSFPPMNLPDFLSMPLPDFPSF